MKNSGVVNYGAAKKKNDKGVDMWTPFINIKSSRFDVNFIADVSFFTMEEAREFVVTSHLILSGPQPDVQYVHEGRDLPIGPKS